MERRILRQRIRTDSDVVLVHRKATQLSELAGLETSSGNEFATAVSEVCRNVLKHVGEVNADFLVEQIPEGRFLEAIISNNQKAGAVSGASPVLTKNRKIPIHRSKVWLCAEIPPAVMPINAQEVKKWRKTVEHIHEKNETGKGLTRQLINNQLDYLKLISNAIINNILENQNYIHGAEKAHQKIRHLLEKYEQDYTDLKILNQHLDQFAYSVSHDLKSPLRNLEGLLTALQDDLELGNKDEVAKWFYLLHAQLARMDKFIGSMLSHARTREVGKLGKLVNPTELVHKLLHNLNVPPNFKIKVQPRMQVVRTSGVRLGQVLSNLIANAYKHHDKQDGAISVSARYNKTKNQVTFKIADDGPGILPERLQTIFKTYKVKGHEQTSQSTGIGLFMIKQIVEEEGGSIWAESDGRGTCFYFTWPVGLTDPYLASSNQTKETERDEKAKIISECATDRRRYNHKRGK